MMKIIKKEMTKGQETENIRPGTKTERHSEGLRWSGQSADKQGSAGSPEIFIRAL
jgi:hypothetical protein